MNNLTVSRRLSVKFRSKREEVDVRKLQTARKSANLPRVAQIPAKYVHKQLKALRIYMQICVISDVERAASPPGGWVYRASISCAFQNPTRHETHVMRLMGRAIKERLAGLFSKLAKINFSLCWNFLFVGPGAVLRWWAVKASKKFFEMPRSPIDGIFISPWLVWIELPQYLWNHHKKCWGKSDFRRPLSCHLELESRRLSRWHLQTPSSVT